MSGATYKWQVSLYIRGDGLDPAQLSAALGVKPSTAHRMGESQPIAGKRTFAAKTGLWALCVTSDEPDPSSALATLISQLPPQWPFSNRSIPGAHEAYIDIFVATRADAHTGNTCEFEIAHEHVAALNRLGLPIRVTVALVAP